MTAPRRRFDIPTATVLVAMISAIVALYLFGPTEERTEIIAGASAFFLVVMSFLRQIHGGGGAAALAIVVIASTLSGCTSAITVGRTTLDRTATVSARIDHEMAEARRRTSLEIRARPDATLEEHRAAMAPFDEALEVTRDVYDAMESTEVAFDAAEAGRDADWMGLGACVLGSFSELVSIAARHIDIPDEAGDVLLLLGALARGRCPEPEPGPNSVRAPRSSPPEPVPDPKPAPLPGGLLDGGVS